MAGAGPHERLRGYLQQLGPQARAMLLAELERSHLLGNEIPGTDIILRALLPEVETGPRGLGRPEARLFFTPLEPFLSDAGTVWRRLGRLERSALTPIWQWIAREVAPEATRILASDIAVAIAKRDDAGIEGLMRPFQDQVAYAIGAIIAGTPQEERARRRLASRVGTPDAFRDLHILHTVFTHRDTLTVLRESLPESIAALEHQTLTKVYAAVGTAVAVHPALLTPALALVMSRLLTPWHLVRLAVKSAESGIRITQAPLAFAVTFVFAELVSMADELRATLKDGRFLQAAALLKRLHYSVRGIRTEVDLSRAAAWARELAALLSEISDIVQSEIEAVPGRVRRLIRPRHASEIRPDSVLDPKEVQNTQALIAFIGVCRIYASELAINHPASHAHSALKSLVDAGLPALVEALRATGAVERSFRQSQVDAAICFAEVLFGPDYAAAIGKAAALSPHRNHAAEFQVS